MSSSNLPRLWGLVTAACTYEGENTVLQLQVKTVVFIAGKKNPATQIFFIRFSIKNFIAKISLYYSYLSNKRTCPLINFQKKFQPTRGFKSLPVY